MIARQPSPALERSCAVAVALGLVLRAAGLGAALGPQEMMTLRPASRPLPLLLIRLYTQIEVADPPLFHVLLRGWSRLVGFTVLDVRLFAFLLGVAAIAAAAWAAHRLSGPRAAWLAAAVVALHPSAVAYSTIARSYCLLIALGFLGIGLLVEAERRDTLGAWSLFFAVALAALLTHNLAPFLVAAALAWLVYREESGRWRLSLRFAMPAAAALAAYCVWIPGLLFQLRSGAIPGEDPSLLSSAYALFGTGVQAEQSWTLSPHPGLALGVCVAAAAALAAGASPRARRVLAALAAGAALSVLLPTLYSYAITPVFCPWRHSLIALPAVCLFWAIALAEAPPAPAACAALLLGAVFAYPLEGYLMKPRSIYPGIAATIVSMRRPGDVLLVVPRPRKDFIVPFYPAAAAAPAPFSLCRPGERLPPSIVVARIRGGASAPRVESCDLRLLRERYTRGRSRALWGNADVTRYDLIDVPPGSHGT